MAFKIIASSMYGKEEVDTAKDRTEAEYLTEEYQLAYGPTFRVTWHEAKAARRTRRPI